MNQKLSYYIEHYGSDKVRSGYASYYEKLFGVIRSKVTSMLEIGIGTLQAEIPSSFCGNPSLYPQYKPGGSLRSWRDFFPNAQVYGVDVAEDCRIKEDRLETFIFSSLDTMKCDEHFQDESLDIIIDDGLHTAIGQLYTMNNFFRKVKNGGLYIIEDCGGGGDGTNIFVDFEKNFKEIADKHEYFFGGNFIVIIKNNSGKGQHTSFDSLYESFNPKVRAVENLTIVSGLWDINREGRYFDHYIENFKRFLDIPVNMFLYLPRELEYLVWQNPNRTSKNTIVRIFNLDNIKKLYEPFWDKTQSIRTNPDWYNQTGESGWLANSPQAKNEWYNPIVQSKMFMLHDAKVLNVFNTEYFIWLDAGISNTVNPEYLLKAEAYEEMKLHMDTFLFLSYPYEANSEIHGFNFEAMNSIAGEKVKYVCRGGLFGGHKDAIANANQTYYHWLDSTLSGGYMGTEESIFSIMAHKEPEFYRRYSLDSNGFIVKFFESLLKKDVSLEKVIAKPYFNSAKGIYNKKTDKTSLYMLGFNFPEQFEATLKSYEKHPEWLERPRKILINNSNDQTKISEYEVLCKKYGFEHIITGQNLGINGGRQLVAEHFDNSDSSYYFFFEDDMMLHKPEPNICRNGFRTYVHGLYDKVHHIIAREQFDFLKLSFTEVYMDNHIQVSWYNVPQVIRTQLWPDYDKLPISGLDPNAPRTSFKHMNVFEGLSYISGEVYYANWPMIVSREGNRKMFLETKWARPYEQTWMSYMFQETLKGNLNPAVLLASPINHNRISHYKPEERREN